MNRRSVLAGSLGLGYNLAAKTELHPAVGASEVVSLPEIQKTGRMSLEECLSTRRSVRDYQDSPLGLSEAAQLLWAAQGITGAGRRTAPSAGALYPLETYLVAGQVQGLAAGIYKYNPESHHLRRLAEGDTRRRLAEAALSQDFFRHASCTIALTAVCRRTTIKYGERGLRYVHMEAGHVAQNVCLQATALGLGCVPVGAFEEARLRQILPIARDEEPLYLLPVGRK